MLVVPDSSLKDYKTIKNNKENEQDRNHMLHVSSPWSFMVKKLQLHFGRRVTSFHFFFSRIANSSLFNSMITPCLKQSKIPLKLCGL